MATFKCKMCGGALEITNNETVATCEYCGISQTLPKLDDERRANLYDRANHFRRNNEFDKATGIYEQILNDEVTDAEAYWSLVLCRYGIEYVEDLASHKRVPTVNRAQYTSIFDDDNYKSALEYADSYQKTIYEAEAKAINEIQKGILAISQKEEPFDVFICYKETDNNGRRTSDSVLANDLYHQLVQEGFKVFFARITLEDKLGSAYEPYIFAALNSAKVMVVLGTKPEHFRAVWVKNEWSRYLALIKNGAKKMLIPAYKDMDPYDLPEEFSHLQAQDMSKLGFMQDLIRGIKKIVQENEPKATMVKETVIAGGNASVEPLLKRVFMFLEDGDWNSANEYCEKVLDIEPENAQAYLGKLMAELYVRKQEALKDCNEPFDDNLNYQKTVRFCDNSLREVLDGYIDYINNRNENDRLCEIYNRAKNSMTSARTEEDFKEAARLFETISRFKDSEVLIFECYEKAEIARKNEIYVNAAGKIAENSIAGYEWAIRLYKVILDFKDSNQKIEYCQKKIEELKAKEEAERIERERQEEMARKEIEKRAKRNKRIAIITIPIVCAVVAFIIVLNAVIIPNGKYNDAVALMEAGKYEEAIFAFEALGGYKDSAEQIANCQIAIKDIKYHDAVAMMDSNVIEAYEALVMLDGYRDSTEQANSILAKYEIEKIKTADVGEYVSFGKYEQDNNISNGKETAEWLVLDKQENKMFLISKYVLDQQPYNMTYTDVTWETCSLRQWLNDTFINNAFSSEEQEKIVETKVTADKNPSFNTNPGNSTQDKVFLISINELHKYLVDSEMLMGVPTEYAAAQGLNVHKNACAYGLRTPGKIQSYVALVDRGGNLDESGKGVLLNFEGVRPAFWVDIDY